MYNYKKGHCVVLKVYPVLKAVVLFSNNMLFGMPLSMKVPDYRQLSSVVTDWILF